MNFKKPNQTKKTTHTICGSVFSQVTFSFERICWCGFQF